MDLCGLTDGVCSSSATPSQCDTLMQGLVKSCARQLCFCWEHHEMVAVAICMGLMVTAASRLNGCVNRLCSPVWVLQSLTEASVLRKRSGNGAMMCITYTKCASRTERASMSPSLTLFSAHQRPHRSESITIKQHQPESHSSSANMFSCCRRYGVRGAKRRRV